ncbi:GD10703 [Drosophila simulans]|uniref:GD10703 n=1 Tax=Drosophila simulans TaxID=7240 RepID=B4QHU4_DROSI|nr:GD10703 [Drosophila simulans]
MKLLNRRNMTKHEQSKFRNKLCNIDNFAHELVHMVFTCCPMVAGDKLPNSSVCGQSPPSLYIVGGMEAQPNQFPWTVLLGYNAYSAERRGLSPMCAGSLIASRYVLTAAHCLSVEDFYVASVCLGEHDTDNDPDCTRLPNGAKKCVPAYVDIDVDKRVPHEQYSKRNESHYNDIALLRLKSRVKYTLQIRPICIWPGIELSNSSFENQPFQIAGWGDSGQQHNSPVLLQGTISGMSPDECLNRYPTLRVDKDIHICAMGRDGTDTGLGDSGSPLMASVGRGAGQFYYLAGITSYGGGPSSYGCGPAVYTKTSSYYEGIKKEINKIDVDELKIKYKSKWNLFFVNKTTPKHLSNESIHLSLKQLQILLRPTLTPLRLT